MKKKTKKLKVVVEPKPLTKVQLKLIAEVERHISPVQDAQSALDIAADDLRFSIRRAIKGGINLPALPDLPIDLGVEAEEIEDAIDELIDAQEK